MAKRSETAAGRLFVAVPLADGVRAAIDSHLASALRGAHLPGRAVPPTNWHLTLRFLGDATLDQRSRIEERLSGADFGRAFELEFTELGAFPRPDRARVVWIGTGSGAERLKELGALVEDASIASGFDAERRPFRAHMTVARLRPEADVRAILSRVPPLGVQQTVTSIVLYRSHLRPSGAEYEELGRYGLEAT